MRRNERSKKKLDSKVKEEILQQWLQSFIERNQPSPRLVQTARDMFNFVKESWSTARGVPTKKILPLLLGQLAWNELWEHLASRIGTRSDNGIKRTYKERARDWKTRTYGAIVDTSRLRQTGFEYDYLIFLNRSSIETIAKDRFQSYAKIKIAESTSVAVQPIVEFLIGEALMHEITHAFETLLNRSIITGVEVEPFVLFSYGNFLRQTIKEGELPNFTGTSYDPHNLHALLEMKSTVCPVDGKECFIPDWLHEKRKKCWIKGMECPLSE